MPFIGFKLPFVFVAGCVNIYALTVPLVCLPFAGIFAAIVIGMAAYAVVHNSASGSHLGCARAKLANIKKGMAVVNNVINNFFI